MYSHALDLNWPLKFSSLQVSEISTLSASQILRVRFTWDEYCGHWDFHRHFMWSQVIQVYVVTKKLGTIGFPLEILQSSTFWWRDPLLPYFSVSKSRFLANFPAPHVDFSQPERLPASEEAQRIGPSLLLRHSPLPIATDGKWNFHFKVFLAELRKPSRMKIRGDTTSSNCSPHSSSNLS